MKPNVLILMLDQLNFKCLGYKNHPVVKTPNIDKLKNDSIEFSQCYVQNAFCLPSRSSYFAGQYLCTHRQYGFTGLVAEDTPCMPRLFAENGYKTFHVGKAHLNSMMDDMGFDIFIPTLPEDMPFATNPEETYQVYCQRKGYGFPTDQVHGGDTTPIVKNLMLSTGNGPESYIGTSHIPLQDSQETYTSQKAIDFINNHSEGPFFMHVSFDRPHGPLSPSEPYDSFYSPVDIPLYKDYSEEQLEKLPKHISKMNRNAFSTLKNAGNENMQIILSQYYGLISHIDYEIGRVINSLKEKVLYDNTIILFYSDHGDMAGYNGMFNKYSNTIYHDNIIRTPMLLKLTDQKDCGREVKEPTQAIDVFPTLADLCIMDRSDLLLEGENMINILENEKRYIDRAAFSESYGIKAVIKNNMKLIYYVNSSEGELYNLQKDPEEMNNLFYEDTYKDVITKLKLEIIKKMTPPTSDRRKKFVRSLFDDSIGNKYGFMNKLHKWDKAIDEAGGMWVVNRDEYRLIYITFEDKLVFEKKDKSLTVKGMNLGMTISNDLEKREEMLNELINYISCKIRPISLISGTRTEKDNMMQSKGPGLC